MSTSDLTKSPVAGTYPIVEVTLTRVIAAPLERVFQAWTDPAQLAKWWGPYGFTNPRCEIDARPGGRIHIDMRAPDGVVYPMTGIVHEIVPNRRLVFTAVAEDHDGNPQLESHTTVTFEEADGKTRLTVHARGTAKVEAGVAMIAGMQAGWTQSLERFDRVAASARE